ncbi:hypothetical protein BGX38DRAFT_1318767 [Terfezia claveryi]|nr:hypothetical protein BGX38DRAFT_1318767 [Terfezia claveryi]
MASKDLHAEYHRLLASDELGPATPTKRRKLQEEQAQENEELVNDTLTSGAHYNFPKMHLISHFADQIAKYGSLPQYSTEICEASHKPLKDAYRRSNHVHAVPQIIHAYTRAHSFAMRERNLEQWIRDLPNMPDAIRTIVTPPRLSLHLPSDADPEIMRTKLQGQLTVKDIHDLETLQTHYKLPDLLTLTARYLARYPYRQSSDPETDVAHLIDAPLEAFITLQVSVPTFNDDGQMIHHLRCTGGKLFRNQDERHDWVFVRHHKSSKGKVPDGLDGRVPAKLNALFKLRDIAAKNTYRLAHVSLMTIVGSSTPDGPEGMVRVGLPWKNHMISIADIEGMAHLVPIKDEELYIVNNRIDLYTWNDIHDGN